MGLKLVELQVALPRTQDMGKIQEQLQQKGQHLQDHLVATQQKEENQKRKQVNKNDETEKNKFHKDGQNSNRATYEKKNKKTNNDPPQEHSQHPYKGNFLDIEG